MNADGSGQRRLTNDPGFADLAPAWSPDGARIVFSRCDDHLGFITGCDLEVMTAAGSGIRLLAGGRWTWVRAEYSPDGRHIVAGVGPGRFPWRPVGDAFRRHGPAPDHQAVAPGVLAGLVPGRPPHPVHRQLLPVREQHLDGAPDGTGLRKLTHFGPAPLQGAFASYSPDGRRIVLQYNGKCPVRGICQYFYVMNADGSGLHAVRTGVANTFLTDWGPAASGAAGPGARPPRSRRTDMRRAVATLRALAVAASLAAAGLAIGAGPATAASRQPAGSPSPTS